MNFARLILPLAVHGNYTYRIPEHLKGQVDVGQLVVVQFAARRHYVGLVTQLEEETDLLETKDILEVIEDLPLVSKKAIDFWQWIARYYLCTKGEVLQAALTSGLKLDHKTMVELGPHFEDYSDSPPALKFLPIEGQSLDELIRSLGDEFSMNKIRKWIEEGRLVLKDAWSKKNRTLGEKAIRRATDEKGLHEFLSKSSAPRQKELLLHFLQKEEDQSFIKRSELTSAPYNSTLLKALLDKQILEEYVLDPQEISANEQGKLQDLSEAQEVALKGIETVLQEKKPALLYGVTSSGKTEIYTHLIQKSLDEGKQALFLLPEIALTTQMILRMQSTFGKRVLNYHSKMSDKERTDVWKRVGRGDSVLLLGARSALLLPFKKLDLIVVDEEHEPSYKQQDPSPRYHARDSALYYGQQFSAKVVLGSATPSLESMENAKKKKFGLVTLTKRFGDHPLPSIRLQNTSGLKEEDEGLGPQLIDAIRVQLDKGQQVILFQNRRGFSPYVICDDCGQVPGCPNCDISLSYHRYGHQLRCHYCGHREAFPEKCKNCRTGELKVNGIGTQRLEERLKVYFPEVGIERLDLDSTRGKDKLQKLIDRFETGQTRILIGTQMVTKGLDFRNVGLVGVISADGLLSYPDFRTQERCYQLIAQVAGRAGRGPSGGEVLIQSRNITLDILKNLRDYEYESIYSRERYYRQSYLYPPFSRIIKLVMAHSDRNAVQNASRHMAPSLTAIFGKNVLGPEEPSVARLKNKYLRQFLIKLPRDQSPSVHKQRLIAVLEKNQKFAWMKGIRIIIDVDPVQ